MAAWGVVVEWHRVEVAQSERPELGSLERGRNHVLHTECTPQYNREVEERGLTTAGSPC